MNNPNTVILHSCKGRDHCGNRHCCCSCLLRYMQEVRNYIISQPSNRSAITPAAFLQVHFLARLYRAVGFASIGIAVLLNRCASSNTLRSIVCYRNEPLIRIGHQFISAILPILSTLREVLCMIESKVVIEAHRNIARVLVVDQITIKACSCTLVYQRSPDQGKDTQWLASHYAF